jgi:hypothetical protein
MERGYYASAERRNSLEPVGAVEHNNYGAALAALLFFLSE